jgi:hypothetical protein
MQHVAQTCQCDSVLLQFQKRREYFLSVYAGEVQLLQKNSSNIRALFMSVLSIPLCYFKV